MKTNLSSQITLTRIPLRYYRPENAFEHSVLTRLEKIPTNIYESAEEGSFAIAKEIATQIRKKQDIGKPFVIALPGGRSPLSVYKELIRMHKEEKLPWVLSEQQQKVSVQGWQISGWKSLNLLTWVHRP